MHISCQMRVGNVGEFCTTVNSLAKENNCRRTNVSSRVNLRPRTDVRGSRPDGSASLNNPNKGGAVCVEYPKIRLLQRGRYNSQCVQKKTVNEPIIIVPANALKVGPKSDGKEKVEVRGIYLENEKAPTTGHAVYVVVEQSNRKVLLLYPWNLQEFEVNAEEFRTGARESYWPENTSGLKFDVQKLVDRIKQNVQVFALRKRTFPTSTVVKVLVELGGMTSGEVESWVVAALPEESYTSIRQKGKIGRQYRLAKDVDLSSYRGRPLVVLEAIQELGEASIRSIVDAVQGKLKSKLNHERVVVYFVNKFHSQGVLELIGEQITIQQ